MLPDNFLRPIALDPLRASVPAGNVTVFVQHIDRIVCNPLNEQAEKRLAVLKRRRAFFGPLFQRLVQFEQALGSHAQFDFGPDPFDMRPTAVGNLPHHDKFADGPAMRMVTMDGHQGFQPAFLHQRHAQRSLRSDGQERFRRFRGQFGPDIVDDQGCATLKPLKRLLSECGECVVAHNRARAGTRPVAAYAEPVLVGVHIGVSADHRAEFLTGHARRDRHDLIGIAASHRCLAKPVEEAQPRLALTKGFVGSHRAGGFDNNGKHAGRTALVVIDWRTVQIYPDIFQHARAVQAEDVILVGEVSACQAYLHHIVIERGHFRPCLANR